jgi:SAM-dependent methyltransferase
MAAREYPLGHSAREMQRLIVQARLLAPITRGFFQAAGIGPGMRVLDVGSGAGDVAILASDLVGPTGEVVGTDREPAAVTAAAARATAEGRLNLSFIVGDPSSLRFERPFDAVVGRYVLMYQPDPAVTLRGLSKTLRLGGIMVFHELDWGGARSFPTTPIYERCCGWVIAALQRGGADAYMGSKLYAAFRQAGLPPPSMRSEAIIGGPGDPSHAIHDLLATMVPSSIQPMLKHHAVVNALDVNVDTLPQRMANEMVELGSLIISRSEIGAWTRQN